MAAKSKRVLVTGAASGVGYGIAERLAGDGWSVTIADRDETAGRKAADDLGADFVAVNIADEASIDAAFAMLPTDLDALVNNAGIHLQRAVIDMTADDWDRIMAVNARGGFLMCRSAARLFSRQGHGRIVNILTKLGFGNPFSSAYMASKSAVWALTQCLAVELAGQGITVNAVAPGHVGPGTGMEAAFRAKAETLGLDWPTFERQVLGTIPLGRWCRPRDVAGAVAYLLSEDGDFVTGEMINVTGGFGGYAFSAPARETPT
ncbi:MAG: SDR family NAD(P)-dependent oxidoreductase [Pseudomonadota bacterium]